jgi:hypothetical protein
LDRTILEHYNVKVIPHATTYEGVVGPSSFVFSAYAWHYIEAGILDLNPALYLGTNSAKRIQSCQPTNEDAINEDSALPHQKDLAAFEQFVQKYAEIRFPDTAGFWWRSVSGMCFY